MCGSTGLGRSAACSSQPVAAWLTHSVLSYRCAACAGLVAQRIQSTAAQTALIVASRVKASPCGGAGRGDGCGTHLKLTLEVLETSFLQEGA